MIVLCIDFSDRDAVTMSQYANLPIDTGSFKAYVSTVELFATDTHIQLLGVEYDFHDFPPAGPAPAANVVAIAFAEISLEDAPTITTLPLRVWTLKVKVRLLCPFLSIPI